MDEIAAKREARRRRILENSEDRLMKITGRTNHTELEDKGTSSQTFASNIQNNCRPNINGIIADGHTSEPNTALNSEKLCNIYEKISRGHLDEDIDINSHAPTSIRNNTSLPHVLSSRLYYILLAAIVNILLILRLDHLFGKTITLPCFTMILVRLYATKDVQERQDESLLFAALALCKIKPEVAWTLKRITIGFNMILGDFALYIFSFTLIHYGLSYCLYDTGSPIIPEL